MIQDRLIDAITTAPLATRAPPTAYGADEMKRLDLLAYAWTGCPGVYMALIQRAAKYDRACSPSPASDWQALRDFATILAGKTIATHEPQMTLP